ncbi:MAG: hypothetical protein AB7I18_05375 [Candidatus Berkiella sp.]
MKYVNEYTMGTAATVATTGLAYYFSPTATLTFTSIAGLATLSLAAVAGTYAAFLGAKAAYNYFKGDTAKVEGSIKDKNGNRRSARLAQKQQKEEVKNENTPSMLKNGVTAVSNTASNVTTAVSTRISNAVGAVKNWWKGEEAAKPAAKEEAAKPAAKEEAAKPAAKEAAKPAAKPVTPAFAAKKQAAKAPAVEMAIHNRPKRNVKPAVYK